METLLVVCCWLVGGFVSGVTGIGGAMVAFPVAALAIPMHELIPLSCILNVAMDGCLAFLHFRHCRVSALWPMLAGAIPGSFLGLYILQMISGAVLQGAVGVLLLYYVYWQCTLRLRQAHSESAVLGGAAGFGAGLLGTAISFDGPPVGAYALHAGWNPRVLLGTVGVFFLIRSIFSCALQASAGFYTPTVIGYAMYGVPATMLGTLCAFPVIKHIPTEVFRRALLGLIALAGLVCLTRSFL